jgi:hypothetical protein
MICLFELNNAVRAARRKQVPHTHCPFPADPRSPKYHTLELGDISALSDYDKPVTIFIETCNGQDDRNYHVLQRLRQVDPKLSVLFPHSRNALGAQQALDAAKCTAVKLSAQAPGQVPKFSSTLAARHWRGLGCYTCELTKHLRDSGVPGEALKRKLKKDISFALRRGTIAQITTALDAAQRAAEAELAVNEVGLAW